MPLGYIMNTYRHRSFKKYTSLIMILSLMLSLPSEAASSLSISQVPLTLVVPSRPQVLIAITNSQSMDGNFSGAIMTGSGNLSSALNSLYNSSSPQKYTVPAGFTPPVQAADASGQAFYTVNVSGILYDNSPSRMNVAKAGIKAIINNYLQTTDFALEDYSTSGNNLYTTWVYYMSPATENFSFTNTPDTDKRYVINPCFKYNDASSPASSSIRSYCTTMNPLFGGSFANSQYMRIGASSDDANINDVLYAPSSYIGLFVDYGGVSPSSPYPPNYSLTSYNNGSVTMTYNNVTPSGGIKQTSPTNAGYVPFSPQVMYAQRGFGYYASQSATSGDILVPMTNLGTSPTAANISTANNLFAPFLNPETNRTSTTEIKSLAVQSPMAGLLSRASTYLSGLAYSGTACPPKKYVVLITDGLPTQDLNGKLWPPLGSVSAQGYGVTATFNADGSLNSSNHKALTDTIATIKSMKDKGILTFVVGVGAGTDARLNPTAAATLTSMAVAGGTEQFYPATDPSQLVDSLDTILISVQNASISITSAAVKSTRLLKGIIEAQASFTSGDSPYSDWTGGLVQQQLDPVTGAVIGSAIWDAQSLLDTQVNGSGWSTGRLIATWNPTTARGVPFLWGNLSSAQQALLQPSDKLGSTRVEYIRGNKAREIRNGGVFRNRSHILGDIVNSQSLYVGPPSGPYFYNAAYATYVTTWKNRSSKLYVGANDGMLHVFDANTGAESFAFIPNAVIANLSKLTASSYSSSQHLYFVDGSPSSGDVQFSDGTWHTLVLGGENAGGNSIYALDVTNPDAITSESILASKVLWEFTETDMGLSYSQPQITSINPTSGSLQAFAVFFGNGYNSSSNKAVLYAVNPQTGALLRKIDLCALVTGACNSNLPQGLSSVAVGTIDGIQGSSYTTVYAGDLQGNLWAVNISDPTPANWTVRRLFQARDASGVVQPITTPPVVSLHPLYPRRQGLFVMFGTGQFVTLSDMSNTQTQTIYGLWDKPATTATYSRSDLQAQTLNLVKASVSALPQDILTTTNNSINWGTQVGWYSDLPVAGQRVITLPQLLSGSFVSTIITPPANVCNAPFSSMLLEVNYATGGAFLTPQLDINADGSIDSKDNYGGAFAVGIGLLSGYVSAPTILGPNMINNTMVKLLTHASGKHIAVTNPNNSPRMTSWWQVQ